MTTVPVAYRCNMDLQHVYMKIILPETKNDQIFIQDKVDIINF